MHDQTDRLRNCLHAYYQSWIASAGSLTTTVWPSQNEDWQKIVDFIEKFPDPFCRSQSYGHITGSALVVDLDFTHVLLTYHRKLERWLQLGGHSEGERCPEAIAHREGLEESGLKSLTRLSNPILESGKGLPVPFDIDVHCIPARLHELEHFHFDFRYIYQADRRHLLQISPESLYLRWIPLNKTREYTTEPSMERQFSKLKFLINHGFFEDSASVGMRSGRRHEGTP